MFEVKAKVEILHRSRPDEPYKPGETLVVAPDLAKRWEKAGVCEIVGPVDEVEAAEVEPEGETATVKRSAKKKTARRA